MYVFLLLLQAIWITKKDQTLPWAKLQLSLVHNPFFKFRNSSKMMFNKNNNTYRNVIVTAYNKN